MAKERVEGAFKDVAGKLQDAVGGLTGDIATQAAGKARQLAGQTQAVYGEAVDQARDAVAGVSESVKQQPLMALLIAGLAGYALGWLILRQRSSKR